MPVKTTVLFVGDEDLHRSVKEGLESLDYSVDFAGSASECLRYVEEKRPDLVLLDVMLPDMDGFALMERLKLTGAKGVPVVYMTDKPSMAMTRKVGILTAEDFIVKPINIAELILRIQKTRIWRCYVKRPKTAADRRPLNPRWDLGG
ncbi:MAG: response regulator [Candidatus Altiarchaeota archaeon]